MIKRHLFLFTILYPLLRFHFLYLLKYMKLKSIKSVNIGE